MAEMRQTIVPHLWFDKEAVEAANFYCDAGISPDEEVRHRCAAKGL